MNRGRWLAAALALLAAVGCSSSSTPSSTPSPTASRSLLPAAEPAAAGEPSTPPAGTVLALPGGAPEGIAADPETGIVAVALRKPDRLALVDGRQGRIRAVVPAPGAARHLELVAPGGPVLLPGEDTGTLAELALPDGAVRSTVPVGRQPHDAAAADGRVYVANEFSSSVSVISAGRVERVLHGPLQPGGVAVTGGRIGVVDVHGAAVYVYSPGSPRQVARVPVGAGPSHAVAVAPGRVAVTDTRGNAVFLVALTGRPRVLARVPVAGVPYGLALDSVRRTLYVTLTARNQLARFAVAPDGTLTRTGTIPTVRQPYTVAVDTATGRVFVTGAADAQLEMIDP